MLNFFVGITILFWLPVMAQAAMNKWYDENGVVHYSDKVPPSAARQAREEINKQGLSVKHYRAAKTPEEIAQERELRERERLFRKQRQKQASKDRVLLRTFQNEAELKKSLATQLSTIERTINNMQTSIHRSERKIIDNQSKAANYEKRGKPVPRVLSNEIVGLELNIDNTENAIQRQLAKKRSIEKKYKSQLIRFQQLKARERLLSAKSKADTGVDIHNNAFTCANVDICKQAWALSKTYLANMAIKHHLANPKVKSDVALQTDRPSTNNSFGLIISREFFKKQGGRILIHTECANTSVGKRFCQTAQVKQVRSGLKLFLSKQLP